jgi:5-methylcytosine-specific restriction endonuclease McrA
MGNYIGMTKKEYHTQWRAKNKEKLKAKRRANYLKNRDHERAQQKEYYDRTQDIRREYNRNWQKENKEYVSKKNKEWYEKNKVYWIARTVQWNKANKEKRLSILRKNTAKTAKALDINSFDYKMAHLAWAKLVRSRDKTCQVCGNDAKQSHHILHKSKYPKLALVTNNGIALCKECHSEVHGWSINNGI